MPQAPKQHNARPKTKTNYQHTKTSTQRGYGYAWQQLRLVILRRDKYLCQECLRNNRVTQAYAVDHIKPKAKGGTDSQENLESLCKVCHNHKTATKDSKG